MRGNNVLILISLAVNLIACIGEAYLDVKKKNAGGTIKHGESALFRGLIWVFAALAVTAPHWQLAFIFAPIFGAQFWLCFNPAYNKFAKQPWWYEANGFFDSILPGEVNRFKKLMLQGGLILYLTIVYFLFR